MPQTQRWRAAQEAMLEARLHLLAGLAFIMAGLLSAGLVAVILEAHSLQRQHLQQAQQVADQILPSIAQSVSAATLPAQLLAAATSSLPGPAIMQALGSFPNSSGAAISNTSLVDIFRSQVPDGVLVTMALLYAGRPVLMQPPPGPELAALLAGLDTLHPEPGFPASVRSDTLYGMKSGGLLRTDVLTGRTPDGLEPLVRLLAVFSPANSSNDTWGWPAHASATECSTAALPCYNSTSGQRWWGQVMVVFNKTALMAPALSTLEVRGYGYRLTSLTQYSVQEGAPHQVPFELASNAAYGRCASPIVSSTLLLSATPLQWELSVCLVEGWNVAWKVPLVVMVVVVTLLVVLLLGWAARKWHEHSRLLQALLPADVLRRLTVAQVRRNSEAAMPLPMAGTPADQLISLLHLLLEGVKPAHTDVMRLLTSVMQQQDFYLPENLARQLQQAAGNNSEVAAALRMMTLVEEHSMAAAAGPPAGGTAALYHTTTFGSGIKSAAQQLDMPAARDADFPDMYAALACIVGTVESAVALPLVAPLSGLLSASAHSNSCIEFLAADVSDTLPSSGSIMTSRFKQYTLPLQVIDKLEEALGAACSLDGSFSAWELCEVSCGRPLSALGYWVFQQSGLLQEFNIHGKTLVNFLRHMEQGYLDNPYHNRTHAADVLQSVHALLHQGRLRGTYADSLTTLACYLAAITHDYEHRGVTNDFLVNTKHQLALRYNDRSPQENHHVAAAFHVMAHEPGCHFLAHLPPADWARLRKLVIDLVLATDMKTHFTIVGQFKSIHHAAAVNADRSSPGRRLPGLQLRMSLLGTPTSITADEEPCQQQGQGTPCPDEAGGKFAQSSMQRGIVCERNTLTHAADRNNLASMVDDSPPSPIDEHEQLLALQVMLKCCDLGHVSAALPIHLQWVAALQEEFFRQGDTEKGMGMACSPLCDRTGQGMTKSQVGFLEVVVLPLLQAFTNRFTAAKPVLQAAHANYAYWKQQQQG